MGWQGFSQRDNGSRVERQRHNQNDRRDKRPTIGFNRAASLCEVAHSDVLPSSAGANVIAAEFMQ
jgi:hypothetical protein